MSNDSEPPDEGAAGGESDRPSGHHPTISTPQPSREGGSLLARLNRKLIGNPRDFRDPRVFHSISLVAFLAWVGLGSDGLSSSAYGPDEAYRALGDHTQLAIFLAIATAATVFIISYAYSRIIEQFPHGGGGYVVATKLLGRYAGVVSGCALLVDYILTITVSIASGADAVFSFLPPELHPLKLPVEVGMLLFLIVINLRGVKESVQVLLPVFGLFVVMHLVLIVGGSLSHVGRVPEVIAGVGGGVREGVSTLGRWGLFLLFIRAYSLGGGTYTGIEAVSNGLQIMREPKVQTGKRTMVYMATSLAFTAGGILVCYLLFNVHPVPNCTPADPCWKTMNAILAESFFGSWHIGSLAVGKGLVVVTLLSEGLLLFVAAQTGFIDGPRVMANLAVDSWLPHRFASLSDRLTTKDGVLLIGAAAISILVFTNGSVDKLVVMYSINVFLTFSLSQLGMCRFWFQGRAKHPEWSRHIVIHIIGLVLCAGILVITILEKFAEGGWLTIVITGVLIALCLAIHLHYRRVQKQLRDLDTEFTHLPSSDHHGGEPDPSKPTAVLLVGNYGGIGIHSLLSLQKMFPNYFANIVFVSVAVIDSGTFKGAEEIDSLNKNVERALAKYVDLARRLGWNASSEMASALDASDALTTICIDLAKRYPRTVFFAGKLIWKRESWWQRILHNETAFQVQRRLQWKGLPMTVIPLRVA
jgi:amino acid transporter